MIIFNTHPPGHLFVSPKYFPSERGTWEHHATGRRYDRFEYYWNIRRAVDGNGVERVYEVDKNPLHRYDTGVADSFQEHLVHDPCHGVPMYALPVEQVAVHHDARAAYAGILDRRPPSMKRFGWLLDLIASTFDPGDVGLTGSFLYGLHQDFSDVNLVFYDERPVLRFHGFLEEHDGLLPRQEVDVLVPALHDPSFSWHDEAAFADLLPFNPPVGDACIRARVAIDRRFVGSVHDPADRQARLGFWLSNTVDPHAHGTFTKRVAGIAMVRCRITSGARGMPSGRFPVDHVEVLCTRASEEGDLASLASRTSAVQVIGEFNRMFIFNEDVIVFGLVQEVRINGLATPEVEILVGGREMGGWILPCGTALLP